MIKETYNKFKAIIKGVSDDTTKDLLLNLQKSLEYCVEENSVLREVLRDDFHCKKVKLSSQQKKRLSQKAISLDKHALEDVAGIFKPETILGWHRNLVGQKYDSSKSSPENKRGPKPGGLEIQRCPVSDEQRVAKPRCPVEKRHLFG